MNIAELQDQMTKLQPYHEVHENPHVQRWVEEMNDTLVQIENALMNGGFDTKEMKAHLAMMGIDAPKNSDEELVLYKAFRLMLGFLKRKLSLLQTQSTNYEKTKRKILELGRTDGIGNRRNVANR